MSFYDDASLIMFPSGYKEDKIYSLKPTDGSGDLTFTRASTATRVNSDGLIETSPVNLVEYSEDFTNAVWTTSKYNATVTANDTTAPNGTLTADKVVFTTDGYLYYATSNFSPLDIPKITFSIYSKTSTQSVIFGGASISGTDVYSFEDVGNGWYRQSLTRTFNTASTGYLQILPFGSNVTKYFWGAQLNIGATAKPYFPTTDRLNVPRIDYTGGGCGSLLLESQRTNLALYSEQFDDAAWVKQDSSVTANSIVSPDGTQNADKLVENDQNQAHYIQANSGSFTAGSYCLSIFAKAGERSIIQLLMSGSVNVDAYANFDLANGVVSTSASSTASIQSFGNGWYRCNMVFTASTASSPLGFYCIQTSPTATRALNYLGNGTSGLYIYGASLEAGSYATSYIPTLASSVTRLADAASKTGISSLIGQTEGTIFWEGSINTLGEFPQICDLNADGNKFIQIYNTLVGGTPRLALYVQDVSVLLNASNIAILTYDTNFKFALGYKNNDYVVYLNGVQVYANTTIGVPPTSNFGLGKAEQTAEGSGKKVNQALLFKTRLTNTQLATLTTL